MSNITVGATGDFTTIQAAINAAHAGDTIVIAAGTYNENLTIDKGLTFQGANDGIDAGGARGTETAINWTSGNAVTVNTTDAVTFDGLSFTGTHVIVASTPNTDVTFTNSVFTLQSAGNNNNNFYFNQPDSVTFTHNSVDATGYSGALFQPVGDAADPSHTTVTFTDNTFTGHGANFVAGDDNDVPVILNLSDVNGTVSGNTFDNVDIGVLVANGTGPLEIDNNNFENLHRDVAGGHSGGGSAAGVVFYQPDYNGKIDIHDNAFSESDAGVRTSGVPNTTVGGEYISIDNNSFTNTTPGLQSSAVGGALHLTNSTVDGASVAEQTLPSHVIHVDAAGGADHYLTIQDAIDHASAGDTIMVAAGTYDENINVNKSVTIIGDGDDTIIKGTFKSDNGIADSGSVADYLKTAPGYHADPTTASGLSVNANNVTIANLQVQDFLYGVNLGTSTDIDQTLLQNVTLNGNVYGVNKGPTSDINHFTMDGGSISDGYGGVELDKTTSSATDGLADNVIIDGTDFSHLDRKGIYAETLSNGHLTNITMDDVGQFGGTPSNGPAGAGGNGIDLNLKDGAYSNIEIDHFQLTDTGASDKDGANAVGDKNGGAIVIEARDQGSYASTPASYTGAVNVHDGVIDGHTSTGIQAGEPGQTNAGPAVTITNVSISGAEQTGTPDAVHGDITNVTQSTMTVNGTAGDDTYTVSAGSTGDIVFNGGGGNDTFTGGAEHDTATYTSTLASSDITFSGGVWNVATVTTEGTDHLSGVEQITDGGGHHFLLVGAGGYATIQAAVDAAHAGDTIMIGAGTWAGANIDKALTIVGSGTGNTIINSGSAGNGLQLTGDIDSTQGGHATVTIEDIDFTGNSVGVRVSSTTHLETLVVDHSKFDGNISNGVGMGSGAPNLGNVTISNSEFDQNGNGSTNGDGDISLFGFVGNALLQNIVVHGGANATPTSANADIGIQINGSQSGVVNHAIGNVVFDNVSVDGSYAKVMVYIQGYTNLDGLDFNSNGTTITGAAGFGQALYIDPTEGLNAAHYVGAGTPPDSVDLSHVTVSNTVINGATGTAIGANVQGDSSSPTVAGAVADTFIGTAGADLLAGADGDDSLTGAGGNDFLFGGAGKDTAHYSGDLTSGNFSYNAAQGVWNVDASGSGEGHDVLSGIETVVDGSGNTFVFAGGNSAYTSDADALADHPGATVLHSTPTSSTDTDAAANSVAEGAANGTVVHLTAHATDAGAPVSYMLADNANGAFQIDATTGVVTVADGSLIDYENSGSNHQLQITVEATNEVGEKTDTTFNIGVTDVGPVLANTVGTGSVAEGTTAVGSVVGAGGDTSSVTYQIIGNADGADFTIDGQGNLSFINAPDFENPIDQGNDNTYHVNVLAFDDGNIVTKGYDISVTNQPLGGLTDTNNNTNHVSEGANTGTTVGITAFASDGGGTPTYSITSDSSNGGFSVDADGTVRVADGSKLDFETSHSQTIQVTAHSGSDADVTNTFTINIDDVPGSVINSGNGNDDIDGTHGASGPQAGSNLATPEADTIHGDGGNDTIDGLAGDDFLFGDAGNDTLIGGAGNDTLTGGAGKDIVQGGADNDTIHISGTNDVTDVLDGGTGTNTIAVDGAGNVTLAAFGDSAALDTDIGVHNIQVWTGNGASLLGTTAANVFDFTGVSVTGLPVIDAGAGNDTITIDATDAHNFDLRGNTGNDTITGGAGNDTINGGAGADVLDGGTGTNTVSYATSTVAVNVNLLLGTHTGGDATGDTLSNFQNVTGSAKNDTLIGDANDNVLTGGAGLDHVSGGAGNDTIVISGTGDASDVIDGGVGTNDTIMVGGTGAATLTGFNGVGESIETFTGNDAAVLGTTAANVFNFTDVDVSHVLEVSTGAGNDTIIAGDDGLRMIGGAGVDTITGGAGDDTIVVSGTNDTTDTITGGGGTDTLEVAGIANLTLAAFNATAASIETWHGNNHQLLGTSGANTFDLSGLTTVTNLGIVNAGSGDDTIVGTDAISLDLRGGAGDDTITAGNHGDTLTGGAGTDHLHGGTGDDTFVISGTGDIFDTFDGGLGANTMKTVGGVTLNGFDAAADDIQSWVGTSLTGVTGTGANETFDFSGLTSIVKLSGVNAGAGNDTIIWSDAAAGNLIGGAGADSLTGGLLNDKLTGGTGSDTFVATHGDDTIVDFTVQSKTVANGAIDDHIDVSIANFADNNALDAAMTQVGKNVMIDLGGGDTLTIDNTTTAILHAHHSDFIL